jgi:hypothetical protein
MDFKSVFSEINNRMQESIRQFFIFTKLSEDEERAFNNFIADKLTVVEFFNQLTSRNQELFDMYLKHENGENECVYVNT